MNRSAWMVAAAVAALSVAGRTEAAEPDDAAIDAGLLAYMKSSIAVYEARDAEGEPLPLRDEPLLRWAGAFGNSGGGALFVWTRSDGRPAAVAQSFLTSDRLWLHEFQSLSEGTFRFTKDGAPAWTPEKAGIEPKPLPGAPDPAASEVGRLVQMRSLARRFTATDRFEERGAYELRLLATPVFRYAGGPVRDGGLFALVNGTDPEVLLMLESRETAAGPKWHYALAPMTGYAVEATLDGRPVWDMPFRKPPFDPLKPFFLLVHAKAGATP